MFPGAANECSDLTERRGGCSLGGPLSAIGLLEDALVVARLTPLTRWTVLGTDALHLEATADGARAKDALADEKNASEDNIP